MGEVIIIEDEPIQEPEYTEELFIDEVPDLPVNQEGGISEDIFIDAEANEISDDGEFIVTEYLDEPINYVTSEQPNIISPIDQGISVDIELVPESVEIETENIQTQEILELSENENSNVADQQGSNIQYTELQTQNELNPEKKSENESIQLQTLRDIKTVLVEISNELSTQETTQAEIREIVSEPSTEGTTIDWQSFIDNSEEFQSEVLSEIYNSRKELEDIRTYNAYTFASVAMAVGIIVVAVLFSKIKV